MYTLCEKERIYTVWIVSTDRIFAEALQITLRLAGLNAAVVAALPDTDDEFLVIDLDAFPCTACRSERTVTFSRRADRGADFVRPCLLREMTEAVLARIGALPPASGGTRPFVPGDSAAPASGFATPASGFAALPSSGEFAAPLSSAAPDTETAHSAVPSGGTTTPTAGLTVAENTASKIPFLRLLPDGVLLQGKSVPLSPAERALLALLLETPGECVPTEVIDRLWEEKGGNTTAVYIRYLRRKLDEPTGLRLIRTVRGRGYCLCLPA